MYKKLLSDTKQLFTYNPRSVDELKHKLDELFESNNAEYKKLSHMYDGKFHKDVELYDRGRYEHYQIENYKKLYYGDEYEIQEYPMDKQINE